MANLVLTMGEPQGVGPLIAGEAWKNLRSEADLTFFVIGDVEIMRKATDVPIGEIDSVEQAIAVFPEALPLLSRPIEEASAVAVRAWIEEAVRLAMSGRVDGVVTNPIDKAVMRERGFTWPGHTEFLADLSSASSGRKVDPVMMLIGGGLRVALATIHIALAEVPGALDANRLIRVARSVDDGLRRRFGLAAPRLAFAGLNPHAGEGGLFGDEEREIINPAAQVLRDDGINITDALAGDSLFHLAREGQFDAVIAMYHDQGLIPVKTLGFHGGVNMTLGLPFIRTSPDHGVAYDQAAAGKGDPRSLIAALRLAASLRNR